MYSGSAKREYLKRQMFLILIGAGFLALPVIDLYILIGVGFALLISLLLFNYRVFRLTPLANSFNFLRGRMQSMINFTSSAMVLFFLALLSGLPIYVVAGALAFATLGSGLTNIYEPTMRPQSKSIKGSLFFLIIGGIFSFAFIYWVNLLLGLGTDTDTLLFIAVVGSITGTLLHSISIDVDDNITVPIGTAMAMWLIYTFQFSVPGQYLILALSLSLMVSVMTYKLHFVDVSGTLSGTLIGLLIISFIDLRGFFILLTFFLLGGIFTFYKYDYKHSRKIAEGRGGIRSFQNVFSNGLAACSFAVAYGLFQREIFLIGFLGAVATATADTLASEIGKTSKGKTILITTLKKVTPGTDGGISLLGEFATVAGAVIIAAMAFTTYMIGSFDVVLIVVAAGVIGATVDSVLGATLEQRGLLENNSVNLISTSIGGLSGLLLAAVLI